jgi:UDP-N-acetyl-D-glucosamine dehydrogenase
MTPASVPDPVMITVVGIGNAGLPLAARAASAGHRVWGLDINPDRVARVEQGIPSVDTVTEAELAVASPRLTATGDPTCLECSQVIVLCVPTPLDDAGRPDLCPLTAAAETVRDHLRSGQLIVIESTTYPGTTDGPLREVLEQSGLRAGIDFALAYAPERVDPGNRTYTVHNTPRLVGGLTDACRDRAAAFYSPLVGGVHVTRSPREAEAAKILENTYRQVNIALVNEFAQICHHMNVDVWDVLAAAETKPFGYAAFRPGAGVGGHCIPADPMYLARHVGETGLNFHLAEVAQRINNSVPLWIADRICKLLDDTGISFGRAHVLLLGVTYKPDVADTRNSPALPLARELDARGVGVSFHDPHVATVTSGDLHLWRTPDLAAALQSADLTVLLQRHRCYDDVLLANARALFDTTGPASHPRGVAM